MPKILHSPALHTRFPDVDGPAFLCLRSGIREWLPRFPAQPIQRAPAHAACPCLLMQLAAAISWEQRSGPWRRHYDQVAEFLEGVVREER